MTISKSLYLLRNKIFRILDQNFPVLLTWPWEFELCARPALKRRPSSFDRRTPKMNAFQPGTLLLHPLVNFPPDSSWKISVWNYSRARNWTIFRLKTYLKYWKLQKNIFSMGTSRSFFQLYIPVGTGRLHFCLVKIKGNLLQVVTNKSPSLTFFRSQLENHVLAFAFSKFDELMNNWLIIIYQLHGAMLFSYVRRWVSPKPCHAQLF